jgi:hypothetical protein
MRSISIPTTTPRRQAAVRRHEPYRVVLRAFWFAAVSGEASHAVVQPAPASQLVPTLQAGLSGQSPDRINNRPAKAL